MQLIACLEIFKRYCRLTYESPLAKKRSVSANLSWTKMAFLNATSFFDIFSPIKLIKNSNSLGDILVKFLCWGHTERYAMYALYAMFETFATPSGHTGCDSYETAEKSNRFFLYRHLYKMLAGRLPWGSDDSDDEVLLYAVGNKREWKWVHDVNMKRREFGEFHHLMKQLRQDKVKFKEYFRMSNNHFEHLLSLIKDDIEKKEVNYGESISAEERLALCLR